MIQRINAAKLRQTLGQVMNNVNLNNEEYIVERKGKPLAAIVPVWMVRKKQEMAEQGLKILQEARTNISGNNNLSAGDVDELICDAIARVRRASTQI